MSNYGILSKAAGVEMTYDVEKSCSELISIFVKIIRVH